jgi:hypothetical protein
MIIVRLLSPEPVGWIQHHQLYSGLGADIVMESITLIDRLLVKFKPKPLKKGIYWLNVYPQCLNGRYSGSARYFEASETMIHHFRGELG